MANGTTKRSRAWCFTINNYADTDIFRLESLEAQRIVVGKEMASTGTPHLQGYVRFEQPVRLSWWKNQFPKAHVEIRRGTETQAAEYCKKDHSVVIDKGVNFDEDLVSSRGKRSRDEEAAEVIDEIEGGAKYGQIRQRHKHFCFWNRRAVLEYIHDEKWLSDNPELNPPRSI